MKNISILLLEDEEALLTKLQNLFQDLDWNVKATNQIQEAKNLLSKEPFDLMVLDRMIFHEDTLNHILEFKICNPEIKILILSAIDSTLEKASAIDLGADDYLAKPFDVIELLARLKSLHRRTATQPIMKYTINDLTIDIVTHSVYCMGKNLNLSQKEFLILNSLGKIPGKIFKKEDLLKDVWEVSENNNTNVVESTINSLRRKLEENNSLVLIKNARFIGYWIEI